MSAPHSSVVIVLFKGMPAKGLEGRWTQKACRAPDQVAVGDIMILDGFKSRPELNSTLAKIIEKDPNNPSRWRVVTQIGGQTISVAPEIRRHIRPAK